jgi:hypothetical protein
MSSNQATSTDRGQGGERTGKRSFQVDNHTLDEHEEIASDCYFPENQTHVDLQKA